MIQLATIVKEGRSMFIHYALTQFVKVLVNVITSSIKIYPTPFEIHNLLQ